MRELELAGIAKINSGKVREIFEVGEHLLLVATDRISAYDVVLPSIIPNKGKLLTQISTFWFRRTRGIVENHLVSAKVDDFPPELSRYRDLLSGRSMLVRRCKPLPIECVVRGYLAGSGWKEYRESGAVCGIELPPGLRESEELPEPIFTPATKEQTGHDINISFQQSVEIVGRDTAERVRRISLQLYTSARRHAASRGIIICDTKFEFGWDGDSLILIDEALTPDSSRFWPADLYQPGKSQPSYDKQYVRDYLETLDWDKKYPGPELPEKVVQATAERYLNAYRVLTGEEPSL